MKQLLILAAFLISIIYLSCSEKDDTKPPVKGNVELFLLKSFNINEGDHQIEESTIVLDDEAFLTYEDLLSYNSKTFTFKIPDNKKDLFAINGNTIHFKAFAVMANSELVYTGYFWPEYSSQGVNWTVISPILAEVTGQLQVRLGYPGMLIEDPIDDRRNDSRIVDIFKRDSKLIE